MIRSFLIPFLMLSALFASCDESPSPSTPDLPSQSSTEILWGMGNEIPSARESPIFNQAPVRMISNWFSKPEDLEWMRYYPERNILATLYGQGYAQELIIYLADHTEYAISPEFQSDLEEMIEIFRGNGPDYGPLYVVLFTEYETYSNDPEYFMQLRDAFMESRKTVKQVYDSAYVSIGLGGYEWSGIEERDFKDWEIDMLEAGDYIAVQAHHHVEYMDRMAPQIRNSVEQLSSYDKPVMLSHFRIWKEEGDEGLATTESFGNFIDEVFTEESMNALAEDGLFAWNFFSDDFINQQSPAFDAIKEVMKTYDSEEADLSHFK